MDRIRNTFWIRFQYDLDTDFTLQKTQILQKSTPMRFRKSENGEIPENPNLDFEKMCLSRSPKFHGLCALSFMAALGPGPHRTALKEFSGPRATRRPWALGAPNVAYFPIPRLGFEAVRPVLGFPKTDLGWLGLFFVSQIRVRLFFLYFPGFGFPRFRTWCI